jgi:hypothetical protein
MGWEIAIAGMLVVLIAAFVFLRHRSRALVEGTIVTVQHDSHATAIVRYSAGRQTIRFGAEMAMYQHGGGTPLLVDVPETMYSDEGEIVEPAQHQVIMGRVSRGLTKLGVAHDFKLPQQKR